METKSFKNNVHVYISHRKYETDIITAPNNPIMNMTLALKSPPTLTDKTLARGHGHNSEKDESSRKCDDQYTPFNKFTLCHTNRTEFRWEIFH